MSCAFSLPRSSLVFPPPILCIGLLADEALGCLIPPCFRLWAWPLCRLSLCSLSIPMPMLLYLHVPYTGSAGSLSRAVRKNMSLTSVARRQVSLTGPIMREEVDNPDSRARLRLRLRAFLSLPEPLTLTECAMSGACACSVSCTDFAGLPRHVSPPRTDGTGTVGMRDTGVIEGSRGRA